MQRGEIYCFACNDMVYDVRVEVERASLLQHIALGSDEAATATAAKKARVHGDSVGCKKITKYCVPRRLEWVPTHVQIQTLKEQAAPPEPEAGIAGLRGLYNLGNTCFLNCVLQGLVHNPGIRDYFLGDYHNRHRCRLRREQAGQQDFVCMGCEMDRLVDECFQGSKAAYTPHSFLFGMWKSSQHLAGYEQQDAHECFISLLDALQESCKHDLESENVHENVDLMQHLFRGFMRSDVRCLECGARSQVCARILVYLARDTLIHSRVPS
jgi:ubiquitin carboxyl-terminal hydrolase 22/27/51